MKFRNGKPRAQGRQQTLDGFKRLLSSLEVEGAEVYGPEVEQQKDHLRRRLAELEDDRLVGRLRTVVGDC